MPSPAFEDAPYAAPPDETDVNLRAYFDAMSESKLDRLDPDWDDAALQEWDGNFRSDGSLMMVCCDRDVGIDEYRRVLQDFLAFRRSRRQRCDSAGDSAREG
ncbi:MAG: hypothetical protein OXJ37_19015 [Bryobacterales bacterium]|nr:hypothetical protein [Bryobacterales bacterium]MDE0264501.1 hypothetical protein [Bryobacterales bacterium]MDE0621659.1 hypothetical protein [Bryobacterales bacterium]